jgi:heparin binding hemagglutinin HbhA
VNIVEDVRKTVTNPKPLYFVAGVGDSVVEAIKDAPARLTAASAKVGEAATVAATKVAGAAETLQSKIALGQLDPKALREKFAEPDVRAAREKAQTLALSQVGRALEVAGKAVETYDGLSERGKVVVDKVLAGRNGTEVEVVTVEDVVAEASHKRETVIVEEVVVVEEPKAAPKAEPAAKAAEAPKAEVKAEVKAEPSKPANNTRKQSTPRRKAADTK